MFKQIVNHLEIADEFEWNARRLFKSETRPPNWTNAYIQCLGDASRERALARSLAVSAHTDSFRDDLSAESVEDDNRPGDIRNITLRQLLRLAAIARSAPAGSQRMRQAAQRIRQVAALLQSNGAMAQLVWWCADIVPVPPGKPAIALDERGAAR